MSTSRVWKYRSSEGQWALRWSPRSIFNREWLAWTAHVLREARVSGARFLPEPLQTASGDCYVLAKEGYWEASPWMPGEPLSAGDSAGRQEGAVAALALFHRATRSGGEELPFAETATYRQRIDALRSLASEGCPPQALKPEAEGLGSLVHEGVEPALEALQRVGASLTRLQPAQVDSRPEHFLMTGDRVTGLIDFGAMRIDTPWVDLARLAGEFALGNGADRDRLVGIYRGATDQRVDTRAVAALDFSGAVLASANWLRWLSEGVPLSEGVRVRLAELHRRLGRLAIRGGNSQDG